MLERFKQLLGEMNRGIYEKETEISLSLLAALAGESIILLGPPGVAKSMVARQLKTAFREAQSFEYLMSRFSTPDEIFGPVSIQKLKTSDTYERAVEGYLPTADVVFLDEIWKAGPAIQNTLLTVINEKIFRNGNREMHLPLKLLVAASNELPAKGEGLEALWDRFVIRIESRPIKLEKNFRAMLLESHADFSGSTGVLGHADFADNADFSDLKITAEEYAEWAEKICKIGVKEEVLDAISAIRKSLRAVNVDEAAERRNIYVSDRRWKNIVRLLRTSAFMQDREEVDICDLLPIYHCLWQEPEERDAIRNIVIRALFSPFADKLVEMKNALAEDIKYHRVRRNPEDGRDYEGEIENLSDGLSSLERQLGENLFASADDKAEISAYLRDFYKELAFTRQDTMKLYEV
ncbi:ATPase family associated with various cellular activities (AAA) [Segatella copri DSM 18205]|jgi:MoxR-like ATPase|uniref:ATPase family associated with various cellular activities (AAA) n=1 Tax=Segatella copri DSM 18205 TaxID=537011 RepID=D1PED8_9BACT|nr:AAA family ATPase [Segatella copri]EFB34867.1 ATPase family associated with various cellular activities (AAA) [Segatella copri DSM 18205]MCW4096492.1 AAA family ATPase [Segatella copri]MQP20789.1 AAA domain-containing protein [Segatella copri DSM 18205]UEA43993.1 AAA family ATPase [Segatella copri DSM 18205]UWP51393.1 AAA family ATPase [Segatella copri DSM 18205]